MQAVNASLQRTLDSLCAAEENVVVMRCLGDAVRKLDGLELETWLELADARGVGDLSALTWVRSHKIAN